MVNSAPRSLKTLEDVSFDSMCIILSNLTGSRDALSLSRTSKQLHSTVQAILNSQSRILWRSYKLPWPLLHGAVHIRNRLVALCALRIDRACLNTVIPYNPATPQQPIGTALHYAASKLDPDWVGFLLTFGANEDVRDRDGKTALLVALSCETTSDSPDEHVQYRIVQTLRDRYLTLADLAEGLRVVPAIAAPITAQIGTVDVASPIEDSNATLNDRLVLHDAVRVPGSLAGRALIDKFLLNHCQVDKRNSENRTALFFAHDPRMACHLISKGASLSVRDTTGGTVLHYLARGARKDKNKIIAFLLQNQSMDFRRMDKAGKKASDYAYAGSDQATKNVFAARKQNK